MKKVLRVVLVACILCVLLVLFVRMIGFRLYPSLGEAIKLRVIGAYEFTQLRISCAIPIPPEEGSLVFLRYGLHPSLAGYECNLKITKGSTVVERSLFLSSRASTLVNVYWYPADQQGGPWIRFQDQEGEILVNIQKQRIFQLLHLKGHVFADELSGGQEGTAVVESSGRIIVSVGGREAQEITGLPIADSPGTYMGRIEGNIYRLQFVTPDQSPEKRIRVLE